MATSSIEKQRACLTISPARYGLASEAALHGLANRYGAKAVSDASALLDDKRAGDITPILRWN